MSLPAPSDSKTFVAVALTSGVESARSMGISKGRSISSEHENEYPDCDGPVFSCLYDSFLTTDWSEEVLTPDSLIFEIMGDFDLDAIMEDTPDIYSKVKNLLTTTYEYYFWDAIKN